MKLSKFKKNIYTLLVHIETLDAYLRVIRSKYLGYINRELSKKLRRKKYTQELEFEKLSIQFADIYNIAKEGDIENFVDPLWDKYNKKLENFLYPHPPSNFLRNNLIQITMFDTGGGEWMNGELAFLEKYYDKNMLQKLLEEDYVGDPLLLNAKYLTSHTSIHHLYNITKFKESTGIRNFSSLNIIEWGGGYGSLARIIKRNNPKTTYTIIDLPLFSSLQWIYLSSIFGKNKVNFITKKNKRIKKGLINIIPLPMIDKFKALKSDLFISTWAISESSSYSQEYVYKRKWFGAKHLLLAYQESSDRLPSAGNIKNLAQKSGSKIEEVPFLPGNFYAFK